MAETTSDSFHTGSDDISEYDSTNTSQFLDEDPETSASPKQIFVKNVNKKLSDADVQSFFEKFGKVTNVRKPRRSKNTAFVTFAGTNGVFKALGASNEELILGKRQLSVEVAKTRQPNAPREKGVAHPQSSVAAGDASWWAVDESVAIHSLPYETLDHIFSFLDIKQRVQMEVVCKRWRMIGKNLPWRSPTKLLLDPNREDSALKKQPLTDGVIVAILSRCGISLRHLTLVRGDRHSSLSGKSVKAIGKYCPNLVEVKLVSLSLTNECLKMLSQGCRKLKSVSLQNSFDFGEEGLSAFFKRTEALECLEISKNYQVRGECFDAASKKLHTLRINDCPMLQTNALEKLATKCDRIQDLRLTHCHQLEPDMVVKTFQNYKETLRVIHMDGYAKTIKWGEGLSKLKFLKELSLRNCSGVTDEVLKLVATKCTNLRCLNVRGTDISDAGVADLASAQNLTVLDISEAHKIIGDGIEVLAAQARLEEVYIRASSQLLAPDSSCGCLARLCPNLRLLDVSGTVLITNALVETVQDSIKEGFLKGKVKLVLGGTSVKRDAIEMCNQLELSFDNTSSQHDVYLDIDYYYDSDDSYDGYSNVDYDFDYYDSSFDGDYADYDDDYDDYADYDDLAFIGGDFDGVLFGDAFYNNDPLE